jgi:hypothetical protein
MAHMSRRQTLGICLLTCLGAGCGTVEYRRNLFSELTLDIPGVDTATLNAFGSWRALPRDSGRVELNGPPYTIDLRVRSQSPVSLEELLFVDSATGDSIRVVTWQEPVRSGALSLFVGLGVDLPLRDLRVEGVLLVGPAASPDTVRFSGLLRHEFRTERKNAYLRP